MGAIEGMSVKEWEFFFWNDHSGSSIMNGWKGQMIKKEQEQTEETTEIVQVRHNKGLKLKESQGKMGTDLQANKADLAELGG